MIYRDFMLFLKPNLYCVDQGVHSFIDYDNTKRNNAQNSINLPPPDNNFESCLSKRHDRDDSAAAAAASPALVAAPTMIHVVPTLATDGGGGRMGEVRGRASVGRLLTVHPVNHHATRTGPHKTGELIGSNYQ